MPRHDHSRPIFPHYEKPPVVEVVCGVLFKPLSKFLAPHIGILWHMFRDTYPECREVPPLDPVIETFDESPQITVELGPIPPLPRVWFIHKSKKKVIQLQRDRFLFNWRKVKAGDRYPRYGTVIAGFRKHFLQFAKLLQDQRLGEVDPIQYELSYINHIPQGEGWNNLDDIGSLFPDFQYSSAEERFLPAADSINWRITFPLPDRVGRMHALIRNVKLKESEKPIILFELTVRGIQTDKSVQGMWEWFDLARQWIVFGFTDLTGKEVQHNVWRRKA